MTSDANKQFTDTLVEFGEAYRSRAKEYATECDLYWNSLTTDKQLMAFYSVVQRICKGELKDQGSYRHVLYRVFGFDMDSYGIGMECGYMELHNSLVRNRPPLDKFDHQERIDNEDRT